MNHSKSDNPTQSTRPKQEAVSTVMDEASLLLLWSLLYVIPLVLIVLVISGLGRRFSVAGLLFVATAGFLILSVFYFFSTRGRWKKLQIARDLENNGQIAPGTITDRWKVVVRGPEGGTSYFVAYQYQPPGGDLFTARQKVNRGTYNKCHDRVMVKVRYLPRDPGLSRIVATGEAARREAPLPSPGMSPWNPTGFIWMAAFCSFAASGILAGLNWQRPVLTFCQRGQNWILSAGPKLTSLPIHDRYISGYRPAGHPHRGAGAEPARGRVER